MVRFWDTSAIVPLCVKEPTSLELRKMAAADPVLVVWWATRTECISAFSRRRRERRIEPVVEDQARTVLDRLAGAWSEVLPSEILRRRCERLLAVHPLRAADAFQLAAALLWSRGDPAARALVSLDERLREAARREGFRTVPG